MTKTHRRARELLPIVEQYASREPVCNGKGAPGQFQCAHYLPQISDSQSTDGDGTIRKQIPKRDRYCKLTSPTLLHLGEGGRDMMLMCGDYKRGRRKYDPNFEEAPLQAIDPNQPTIKTGMSEAALIENVMSQVHAMVPKAISTGVPMIAEGGGDFRETEFNGPPLDATVTVADQKYLAQGWHHRDRGWLVVLPKFGLCAPGTTRDEATQAVIELAATRLAATTT